MAGGDVEHSPLSSAEVKNEWSYTSAPPICLNGSDKDSFTVCDGHFKTKLLYLLYCAELSFA